MRGMPKVTVEQMLDDPDAMAVLAHVDTLTNAQIGDRIGLTRDRVKYLVRRWFAASGEMSRTGLAAWGKREGLVDVGQVAAVAASGGPVAALNPGSASCASSGPEIGAQTATGAAAS
jgi:hypothetical protein